MNHLGTRLVLATSDARLDRIGRTRRACPGQERGPEKLWRVEDPDKGVGKWTRTCFRWEGTGLVFWLHPTPIMIKYSISSLLSSSHLNTKHKLGTSMVLNSGTLMGSCKKLLAYLAKIKFFTGIGNYSRLSIHALLAYIIVRRFSTLQRIFINRINMWNNIQYTLSAN